MYFASGVPTVPVQRRMNLAEVVFARRLNRPPWTAIFSRAFALVADEFPEFRRVYCKFPRPHLYEYPYSVAHLAVSRDYKGEPAVLGVRIKNPANASIDDIATLIRNASTAPIESIKAFRQAFQFAAWPYPVRRMLWWLVLNIGRFRPNYFGTFGVSVYSALGADSLHPLTPLTCTLNYGLIGRDGTVDVRLIYDHRVMDGPTVARALVRLEEVLTTTICAELANPHLLIRPRLAA
jgi:hypothetical protein